MDDLVQAWRAHLAPRPVVLSNGLEVLLRSVSLESLVIKGEIPLTLFHSSQEATQQRRKKGAKGIDEEFLKMMPAMHAVIMAAAVTPRIAEEADLENGVVSIHDIALNDRLLLFEEANRATRALRPFRGQPDADAGAAPDGGDVSPAAE